MLSRTEERAYLVILVLLIFGAMGLDGYWQKREAEERAKHPTCTCVFKDGETIVGSCIRGKALCTTMVGPKGRPTDYQM